MGADQKERIMTRGVGMYPSDWAVVKAFAKDNGFSESAALRVIVRQWRDDERRRVRMVPIGDNDGRQPAAV